MFQMKRLEFKKKPGFVFLTGRCGTKVWCLKITEKVLFNIVSEASYVYILSGQKFIKIAKSSPFWSVLIGQKLPENAKVKKFKCNILSNFQTMCKSLINK